MDRISKEHRSWNMSRIRGTDTKPERVVRSALHRKGYRFRLHRPDLPGRPDIVLPKYHTAVFVHGCFWHRHANCPFAYTPKSSLEFWEQKFSRNQERDKKNISDLRRLGWRVATIWECETNNAEKLAVRLDQLLSKSKTASKQNSTRSRKP